MFHTTAAMAPPSQRRLNSRWRLVVLLFVFAVGQLLNTAQAQNRTTIATTDPAEGLILNFHWTFGINALSGELPRELGLLTDLRSLSITANNFSGPLPSELGNLTRLTQIYFHSAGVSGPIPASFARLQSLERVWGSDNELTGQIPDFIGSWSNLVQLRFHGNSFQGRIPPSFSNLTALNDLVLRNNNVSGSIPSYFGGFQSLTLLFLGNNRLIGTLPSQKSPSLQTINLVSNNFTIDNSNNSTLPHGLDCLQRNFRCNRGSPICKWYKVSLSFSYNVYIIMPVDSSFAIKCGGPQIRSSDQIVYERDNETRGPATYYMINTQRWAVSNVGIPSDSNNPQYMTSSSSQYTNTLDPELFQTARISTGSLRYYGLGLENGNYTLRLQFAETPIQGTRTWWSLGRRVFDIYVQVKDFDIRREAGGASFRAVTRDFTVQVSENYMEIHLFWADFVPTVSNNLPNTNDNRIGLIVGIVAAVAAASLLSLIAVYYVLRRRKIQKKLEDEVSTNQLIYIFAELLGIDARPYMFSYAELRAATDEFNPTNKLGEGGFGPVYKGTLEDGRVVAVKQLSVQSHQGKSQFVAEIATISAVQHRNLVKLYGCCIEGDKRLLVYEYLENKSLDQVLFGTGIARGLAYLHEESRIRIVHRDVKASNILLDSDLVPKISDFGLAKLYDDKKTHISTRVAGTIGYLAPEYAMRGHLTEKADIFSFGVVALEIISGRPNSDSSLEDDMIYLLEWAWNLHENNEELEMVDPTLRQYNADEVRRFIGVSLLCTQASPALRPAMSRVVAMLSGDNEILINISHKDTTTTITTDNSLINHATPMLHEIIGDNR
ncbi:Serine/threonine protein kinase [Handroanthus impetiginosus]|uniref:non-specific serine/threonine protein kinase n=1 Tax=Handroanthus impetiginosus TaxID=429701 RepID=A0A2G9HQG6_9LAMI|nr:Serine/threonine protein kinase [Handroanthus impetiginosus]